MADERRTGLRLRHGFRARVLGFSTALLVVATLVGLVVQRAVLIRQADDDAIGALVLEREELEQLAGGRNPATGEPFGDERPVLDLLVAGLVRPELVREALAPVLEGRVQRARAVGVGRVERVDDVLRGCGGPVGERLLELGQPGRAGVADRRGQAPDRQRRHSMRLGHRPAEILRLAERAA